MEVLDHKLRGGIVALEDGQQFVECFVWMLTIESPALRRRKESKMFYSTDHRIYILIWI